MRIGKIWSMCKVLRRIFGPKSDEVTGELRKLHNEKLSDLYSSPVVVRVIEVGRMRWAGIVARMGERRAVYRALVGKAEGKTALEDSGVDGTLMLKRSFRKWDGGVD
jgi:hypothetical protein